jgi:hypothetical protein
MASGTKKCFGFVRFFVGSVSWDPYSDFTDPDSAQRFLTRTNTTLLIKVNIFNPSGFFQGKKHTYARLLILIC